MAIAASPDGSRIYVVGDFTQVNGQTRNRIAALDVATGALITSFAPTGTNARARALTVTANGVYLGGSFSTAGGQNRQRLAAYSPTTGGLMPWAPTAEQEVIAMTAPPGLNKMVWRGRFTLLDGNAWYGLGALDATTGGNLPWPVNNVVRDAEANAAIWYLTSDTSLVYGTGYVFGSGGNLENAFAADSTTGNLRWVVGASATHTGLHLSARWPTRWARPQLLADWLVPRSRTHDSGSGRWRPPRPAAPTTASTSAKPAGDPAPNPCMAAAVTRDFTGQSQGGWGSSRQQHMWSWAVSSPGSTALPSRALLASPSGRSPRMRRVPQGTLTSRPTLSSPTAGTARATFRARGTGTTFG